MWYPERKESCDSLRAKTERLGLSDEWWEKDFIMADRGRKNLVWEIRKRLLALSPEELFHIAKEVGPVPGEDPSELDREDTEGCFEYIHKFMYSKHLLESEDMGMVELLVLNDAIDMVIRSRGNVTVPVDSSVNEERESTDVASQSSGLVHLDNANVPATGSANVTSDSLVISQPLTATGITTTSSTGNVVPDDVMKMLESYEDLSKKLRCFMNIPTTQAASQPTAVQPTLQNIHTAFTTTAPPTPVHPTPQNNNTPSPSSRATVFTSAAPSTPTPPPPSAAAAAAAAAAAV